MGRNQLMDRVQTERFGIYKLNMYWGQNLLTEKLESFGVAEKNKVFKMRHFDSPIKIFKICCVI